MHKLPLSPLASFQSQSCIDNEIFPVRYMSFVTLARGEGHKFLLLHLHGFLSGERGIFSPSISHPRHYLPDAPSLDGSQLGETRGCGRLHGGKWF